MHEKLHRTCTTPTEAAEQRVVVEYLRRRGLRFCAVPNGGQRTRRGGVSLQQQGVERGAPDLLVFSTQGCRGLAIELKRAQGGRVSRAQERFLADLRALGWRAEVCAGAKAAIALIEEVCGPT